MNSIVSKPAINQSKSGTKGGGVTKTIDGNILVGPDAVEQPFKEDYSTDKDNIDNITKKHFPILPLISPADIITYFSGNRAATYEEDFIIEKSEYVKNLIHAAGIQSPGLASAPAIALDIEKMTIEVLSKIMEVKPKKNWKPYRKGIPELFKMSEKERNEYIKKRPDYGIIICRCEEISKGEIIDAINSPIPANSLDAIKRRVRPGMGRCQGGFCTPSVVKLIEENANKNILQITKKGGESYLVVEETKKEGVLNVELYDVVVIGAGPAGLAAGLSSYEEGAKTLIIEREKYPGGILKQCIHDGFGLIEFKERLTGPEYAERFIKMVRNKKISILTSTFVTSIKKEGEIFILSVVSKDGIIKVGTKAIVLANGCRERTSKQIGIHGTRPSGVMTAGLAQYFVNIMGYLPCKKCIILGSGDIGLIMARRLTLEGAKVLGVYEVKNSPSGLTRNVVQCLNDFSIPLYLSKTVTKIFGYDRVEGVEICDVDENMNPIKGSEKFIECDGVILSVGLIPENEIAESLNVEIDKATKGPYVDQNFMTKVDGIFSCGNALHVNDLVDYVTESGRMAGKAAAKYASSTCKRALNPIEIPLNKFLYAVPQYIDINSDNNKVVMYLRSRDIVKNVKVIIKSGNEILYEKRYTHLNPPEMERIEFNLNRFSLNDYSIKILMQEG